MLFDHIVFGMFRNVVDTFAGSLNMPCFYGFTTKCSLKTLLSRVIWTIYTPDESAETSSVFTLEFLTVTSLLFWSKMVMFWIL